MKKNQKFEIIEEIIYEKVLNINACVKPKMPITKIKYFIFNRFESLILFQVEFFACVANRIQWYIDDNIYRFFERQTNTIHV